MLSKAQKGVKFYEYWNQVKNQTSLPLIFYNELDFLGANLHYLANQQEQSLALYESLVSQSDDLMSRGLVLNNYGVSLTKDMVEKTDKLAQQAAGKGDQNMDKEEFKQLQLGLKDDILKIAKVFEDSILENEGQFFS